MKRKMFLSVVLVIGLLIMNFISVSFIENSNLIITNNSLNAITKPPRGFKYDWDFRCWWCYFGQSGGCTKEKLPDGGEICPTNPPM